MKTLEELVKELGLKPTVEEIFGGRIGDYVVVLPNNEYFTISYDYYMMTNVKDEYQVIEVKPE